MGKIDFSNLYISLDGKKYESLVLAKETGAATVNYGLFINTIISFIIIGFAVFILVKQINRLKRKEDSTSIAPTQKSCAYCRMSISIKATRCPFCTSQLEVIKD